MLQSADIAAKSLSGNTLTSRKVHLVGAAGHEPPSILWPNPQVSVKQPLNFERMTIYSGDGSWQAVDAEAFTFAAVGMAGSTS
jgi:hypothetical protein